MSKPKLLEQVRTEIRRRNYSYKTETAYVSWIRRYIKFHNTRHPKDLGKSEIVSFLNDLANNKNVAASTQNQAFCALVFLYEHILEEPIGTLNSLKRAKKPKRLPVVLSKNEVARVIKHLSGVKKLVVQLLYGSGFRVSEALRLRVQELLGHKNLKTTMIYTHVINKGGNYIKSPVDIL